MTGKIHRNSFAWGIWEPRKANRQTPHGRAGQPRSLFAGQDAGGVGIARRGNQAIGCSYRSLISSLRVASFLALFVYARLISQSRGSIPYIGLGVEASSQCGCSATRVLAPH